MSELAGHHMDKRSKKLLARIISVIGLIIAFFYLRPAKPFLAVLALAAGLTNNPFEKVLRGPPNKKQTNKGENQCQESKREELFSFCPW